MSLISNAHNLRAERSDSKPFGLRAALKPGDPLAKLLGPDWNRVHWFATAALRDAAMADMIRKHEYSRPGDAPALVLSKEEKLAARLAKG